MDYLKIVMAIVFIAVIIFFNYKGEKELRQYEFTGVIQKIAYDVKGFPYVTVNNHTYYLDYGNWSNLKEQIQIGDSIFKKKGELKLKVYDYKKQQYKVY